MDLGYNCIALLLRGDDSDQRERVVSMLRRSSGRQMFGDGSGRRVIVVVDDPIPREAWENRGYADVFLDMDFVESVRPMSMPDVDARADMASLQTANAILASHRAADPSRSPRSTGDPSSEGERMIRSIAWARVLSALERMVDDIFDKVYPEAGTATGRQSREPP